ncbi:hypothetical protein NF27_KG00030 [Candidatus Jidaibacter acanthamoeba]|uniref:Uncharacterized protein n=1 Tax=Candidatus Jidaibacter acanthamoebae TaxID=86105 RepID=A0A0C1QVM5_9RICK|nr:hypothetical protein [Candidatus Jidaibacter acanthamoeba]KIE04045.1 hypothetical protein NF27_KG00030 [Candidatus Jidaibacter acanthamoeba]
MTKKTISISPRPIQTSKLEAIDKWVNQGTLPDRSTDDTTLKAVKRFTLTMPDELHKKIKMYCVQNNIKIHEKLIEIITKEFK